MTKRLTTEEFIGKARSIHGDFYDYSLVEYVNNKIKVVIACPIHGEFTQKPSDHLKGQGCKTCGYNKNSKSKKSNTQEFIEKAKEVHSDKYDYSKVEYINSTTKVTISCYEHGDFEISPNSHLNGRGCIGCSSNTIKKVNSSNKDQFIQKAKEIHNNKYDYSKSEYIGSKEKITINCTIHGDFEQKPNDHLNGHGCPVCSNRKKGIWSPDHIKTHHPERVNDSCTFYIVEFYSDNEKFIKIGITTRNINERYQSRKQIDRYCYEVIYEHQSTLIDCLETEQKLLKEFKEYRYDPIFQFEGSTECLQYEVLDGLLDIIQY